MARALRSLTLVFLAARAGAQKDSCATGAEGRWAGTHARLLALDESKLPNLYQAALVSTSWSSVARWKLLWVAVRSAKLRLMDVQIYRTAPWRATAVFAGAERDDDDDDDGLAWGEVISYEPSPDLGDVPVAVPVPSAPPVEAIREN